MHPVELCVRTLPQSKRVLRIAAHNVLLSSGVDGYIIQSNRAARRQALKRCYVDSEASADSAHKMGHYRSYFSYTTPACLPLFFLALEDT